VASGAARHTPDRWRTRLVNRGLIADIGAWRAESVTARAVRNAGESAGLRCIGQETVSWQHGRLEMDCLSLFAAPGSRWDRPYRKGSNPDFAAGATRLGSLYAAASFPESNRR
jgi:hypothetical protein